MIFYSIITKLLAPILNNTRNSIKKRSVLNFFFFLFYCFYYFIVSQLILLDSTKRSIFFLNIEDDTTCEHLKTHSETSEIKSTEAFSVFRNLFRYINENTMARKIISSPDSADNARGEIDRRSLEINSLIDSSVRNLLSGSITRIICE